MVPGGGGVPAMQRIPLPGAEMLEEEPLYVNAKQYHRILKRRQARAKLEAEGKIPKERRVCRVNIPHSPIHLNKYFVCCRYELELIWYQFSDCIKWTLAAWW